MQDIIFEDAHILAVKKPVGLLSESTPQCDGLADLLQAHVKGYIGVIHRLDRGVGGVMVYAKTPAAAAHLSEQVRTREMKKEYLALGHGKLPDPSGRLSDLLFHDRRINKTFVADRARKGVKEAILDYETLRTLPSPIGELSLLRVRLLTGRTHQVRVQLASRGLPLVGDRKYGAPSSGPIGLFCRAITLRHPVSGEELTFSAEPSGKPWELLDV